MFKGQSVCTTSYAQKLTIYAVVAFAPLVACRPTSGIPPQVCFLRLPGPFIAAAQVPCATTAHGVAVLVCVGSVTISSSRNPAIYAYVVT